MRAGPDLTMAWSTTATGRSISAMAYTQRLAEANLVPSVGSVGDSL
jgi:hypothetical protein